MKRGCDDNSKRSRFQSRAFTLVELLICIGIIAILIGLLIPMLGRSQAAARDMRCKANLRTLMQAALIYATES